MKELEEKIQNLEKELAEARNIIVDQDKRTINNIKEINTLLKEINHLKDDFIMVTKAFCLVK